MTGPITLDEASLSRIAVLDGIWLGFFMEPDVRGDIEAGRLVRVLEDWTPELSRLCLYYPGRRNASGRAQRIRRTLARSPDDASSFASTHPSKTHQMMGFQLWRTRAEEFRTALLSAA